MDSEFICMLHSENGTECSSRRYDRECQIEPRSKFASVSCPYRVQAVVISPPVAEENVESPVNSAQQPQVETADIKE